MRRLSLSLAALTAPALAAGLLTLPTSTAQAAPEQAVYGELARNGTFTTTTEHWWGTPGASVNSVGGALRATVEPAPASQVGQLYRTVVGQNDIKLRRGARYTLSFDARASTATKIKSTVQLGTDPYPETLANTLDLTTTTKRFSWTFTSSLASDDGHIDFQVGGQRVRTDITLDNVSLTTSTAREGFFVDPDSNARRWVDAHSAPHPVDVRAARIGSQVADRTTVKWFGGWNTDIKTAVDDYVTKSTAAGQLPTLVAYNIPGRDCGGASGGGAKDVDAYKTWMNGFIEGIAKRPALVVLEPDAVAQADVEQNCLTPQAREARFDMLWYANQHLDAQGPHVKTYIDAGNATWTLGARREDNPADQGIGLSDMADLLGRSGIYLADGVAVNVANYHSTDISNDYGRRLAARVKERLGVDTTWVVDTSRNGNGAYRVPGDETSGQVGFCNPPLRKLGPASRVGEGGAAYYLWIKNPGDSDGRHLDDARCPADGPQYKAGDFSPEFAERLIDGS
ncbi:glycoside hydrolase family 6 protein [Streptomyces sp. bgisy126]|uniref:glycoside hydrolase family 6 protein n=1 Tax=unclassified Streptomyces TaxID=2593676 RepID=UPI003EC00638